MAQKFKHFLWSMREHLALKVSIPNCVVVDSTEYNRGILITPPVTTTTTSGKSVTSSTRHLASLTLALVARSSGLEALEDCLRFGAWLGPMSLPLMLLLMFCCVLSCRCLTVNIYNCTNTNPESCASEVYSIYYLILKFASQGGIDCTQGFSVYIRTFCTYSRYGGT